MSAGWDQREQLVVHATTPTVLLYRSLVGNHLCCRLQRLLLPLGPAEVAAASLLRFGWNWAGWRCAHSLRFVWRQGLFPKQTASRMESVARQGIWTRLQHCTSLTFPSWLVSQLRTRVRLRTAALALLILAHPALTPEISNRMGLCSQNGPFLTS